MTDPSDPGDPIRAKMLAEIRAINLRGARVMLGPGLKAYEEGIPNQWRRAARDMGIPPQEYLEHRLRGETWDPKKRVWRARQSDGQAPAPANPRPAPIVDSSPPGARQETSEASVAAPPGWVTCRRCGKTRKQAGRPKGYCSSDCRDLDLDDAWRERRRLKLIPKP